VVSNCVLNLVATEHKDAMFGEIFRVLRRGGRAVISDIVSDVPVPERLRADPELWSGCISGAYQEEAFLAAFERAGFHGVHLVKRDSAPWQVVEGVEFRSVTVIAYKGKQGECRDHGQAVIYKGPFRAVLDDDEHVFTRGVPPRCARRVSRSTPPSPTPAPSSCWRPPSRWIRPRHRCSTAPRPRRSPRPGPPRWRDGRCPA